MAGREVRGCKQEGFGRRLGILPPKNDSLENRLYYEYLDFYKVSQVNYLSLSRPGDYRLLLERLKKTPEQVWSSEDQLNFRSLYQRFSDAYYAMGGKKLPITTGDALLVYLKVYTV